VALVSLSSAEARQAARTLDSVIESRIDLALTPAILAKLAAKGITEAAARVRLRECAAKALLSEYAR
jgi:hypothetical protein